MTTLGTIACTLLICAAAVWITYIVFNRGIKVTIKHVHDTGDSLQIDKAQAELDEAYAKHQMPTQDDIAASIGEIVRGIIDED